MPCCARCGREVYHAEQRVACNRVWHSFCFSCYKCRKLLDPCTFNTYKGEIFCDACYRTCEPCICRTTSFMPCGQRCRSPCRPCKEPCKIDPCKDSCCSSCSPCGSRDTCSEVVCCKPLQVKTRSRPKVCCCKPEAYCLQPVCPKKKCHCRPKCLAMDHCPPDPCPSKCRLCTPVCCSNKVPCCRTRPVSACSNPIPRETSCYYNRNHDNCPDPCCAPADCCYIYKKPKCTSICCQPCCAPRCQPCRPPKCCASRKSSCPNCSFCSSPLCSPLCPPPCMPYCPPPKDVICYPPLKCHECPPCERILYHPRPEPPLPKCCTCGLSNPCNCDLNYKRKVAICEQTPNCRRCGQKVYAAEIISAAGGSFHSCCFSCYCCRKPLEITNVYENQGEIYCRNCYIKFFAVKGYGYGSVLETPL